MTRQITFLPSGRVCPVEEHETILQACLRAGLSPIYGCSNGNCGFCEADLKSGEIAQVRHHDHALASKDSFLMCANRALTDIEIEADITQGPDDIPLQEIATKVKGIEYLDSQVIRLDLQTPRSQRLRFIAGQSVMLELGDGIATRLAVASCPCDDRNIQFHIPDVPDDPFSEALFAGQVKRRDTVGIRGPLKDQFYLDDKDDRPSLILCWHTGFAAIAGLVEHMMALEFEKDIHLCRFSPTPDRQYLSNLSRSWADAFDNIHSDLMPARVTLLSTRQECTEILSQTVAGFSGLADYNAYVAGPPNFVAAAEDVLAEQGLSPERLKTRTDWIGAVE